MTWEGVDFIGIPHGIDETKLLRNLGIDVPAPILEHYSFPATDRKVAFDKQKLTAASMTMNLRSYVLNSMGTGKTRSCIWAFDYLKKIGRVHKMLVVAPLSTLQFTWERECFITLPELKTRVLVGTAKRRRKLLAEDADIYIINHDGLKVIKNELAKRFDIDCICFDEAAAYRNVTAYRSKLARSIAMSRKYVWGMTGSPTPTSPLDSFGLAHLITPMTAPRGLVRYRQETMLQVSQFKWVARKDAADTVSKVLQPAVRYTLDEIIELPPVIEREVEVALGPRQQAVYDALKKYAGAQLKEGTITAANAGVVFSKMLQTSLGYVYVDDASGRRSAPLDNTLRIDALLDMIESSERKVIVFSPFKNATAGISEVLAREKIDYAEVTGDTTHKARTEIFDLFQHSDRYRVLNAHPECMSHGITLTAADTIIWYGPTSKLETYSQANARIRRVGQAHKQQILKLVATPIERMVYRRLDQRHDLQENVLELLQELTKGG